MNELLLRFLDDRASLTEAEARDFSAWLEASPEALGELRAQLVMDELLSRRADGTRAVFVARVRQTLPEQVTAERVAGASFIGSVLRRLGLRPPEHPSHPSQPWLWAAAACTALLAAMAFLFLHPEPPHALLAAATGDVRVRRAQKITAVKAGFVLRAGDALLTGADGGAEVAFPGETTRLAVGENAEFGVVTARPDKQLTLAAGTLRASVARQPAQHPMVIRTPTAKAEVLGTKFELSATPERTRMKVEEGRVLIARSDEESGVVIEARQSATVTATEPVAVETPPAAQSLDAGLLARWTFDESAADVSGHGHDLRLSGKAAWSAGHAGRALDLHAAPVEVETPRLTLPAVFTIAVWLRIEPGVPARAQPVLSGAAHAAGLDGFWLSLPPTFPGSGVVLEVSGQTMRSHASARRGVVLAGRWHHLAVIVNSTEGRATFHVDGVDVTESAGLRHDFQLAGALHIGHHAKLGPPPFDGQLDDLRIYGRALTAPEINALAQ